MKRTKKKVAILRATDVKLETGLGHHMAGDRVPLVVLTFRNRFNRKLVRVALDSAHVEREVLEVVLKHRMGVSQ